MWVAELGEDVVEELLAEVEHLVVVLIDAHFNIEADELGQVAVRVGVFGAEDGRDFKNTLKIALKRHLLVELGRLREEAGATHVVELEDGGTALGRDSDHLGAVDFDEVAVGEELAEVLADAGLDAEDGVGGGRGACPTSA